MSSSNEEYRLITALQHVQLGKLRANAHKKHWAEGVKTDALGVPFIGDDVRGRRIIRAKELFALLRLEMDELEHELHKEHGKESPPVHGTNLSRAGKIRGEAADASNILAMIADVVSDDSPDPVETCIGQGPIIEPSSQIYSIFIESTEHDMSQPPTRRAVWQFFSEGLWRERCRILLGLIEMRIKAGGKAILDGEPRVGRVSISYVLPYTMDELFVIFGMFREEP